MPIRVLPPEIANRIAAGEVVERPASVVKELLENAIDAGARDIQVEIAEGGRRLIRVSDDGCGIPASDTEVAFARHATSKLCQVEDLERIGTLGFRGEALASIAAVSRLILSTRSCTEELGTLLELDGGLLVRREPLGRSAGTSVAVEHLFHNVPARLKFLRAETTEAGHIAELLTFYALAYPHLRFKLTSGSRLLFRSDGTGELRDAVLQVFGLELLQQMLEIEPAEDESAVQVRGYVGVPALHRASRQQMIFFVNGRWIRDRSLNFAVQQAYHTLQPAGRYPVAVILLHMDPAEVDVNVHPTKAEVRFREPGRIFAQVQRHVRATLLKHAPVPSLQTWNQPLPISLPERGERTWSAARAGGGTATQEALRLIPPAQHAGAPVAGPAAAGRLPILRVIGQVRQMYIIAEGPEGLYLIDQHAAHERVLYERLSAQRAGAPAASQPLLEPLALTLGPREAGVLQEYLPALQAVGFDLEPFGEGSFLLRALPADWGTAGQPPERLLALIEELERGEAPLSRGRDAAVMAAVCKQAAVKAGQTLSHAEMVELIEQLEATQSPRTCPHGRPTMIHLSTEQLAKQFSRT